MVRLIFEACRGIYEMMLGRRDGEFILAEPQMQQAFHIIILLSYDTLSTLTFQFLEGDKINSDPPV